MNPTVIGIAAGCMTAVSMLPQLVKMLREKKAQQISPFAFFILIAGLGLWVVYGIYRNDFPLIYTNGFSFLLNLLIAILSIRYQKKHVNKKIKAGHHPGL